MAEKYAVKPRTCKGCGQTMDVTAAAMKSHVEKQCGGKPVAN